MKKTLLLSVALALGACEAPNYGEELSVTSAIVEGVEIGAINGYVVEVTNDNRLKIRVPREGDLVQEGVQLNPEGLIEVALAAVQLPTSEVPLAAATTDMLAQTLEGKQVKLDLLRPASDQTEVIESFIYIGETRLQDLLLENGLAIIDEESPYYTVYKTEFDKFQQAAENNELGLWAIDGLITLSNQFDTTFSDIAEYTESQALLIEQRINETGWNIQDELKKITGE